jgi:hypothetical protein
MTRLIGGNISDTPIKDIGDGSAFSAGVASSTPALVGIGTIPAIGTGLTNFDERYILSATNGQNQRCCISVKWADNDFGIFWCKNTSSYELYYLRIQTNSDGSFLSESTKTDLSGDFTGTNGYSKTQIAVKKLSASRVAVAMGFTVSGTRGIEVNVYDKSGDTLSKHGTVQDLGTPSWASDFCFAGLNIGVRDADTIGLFNAWTTTFGGYTDNDCHPMKVTTTKSVGTRVDSLTSYREGVGGVAFTDDTGKIWTIQGTVLLGGNTLQEWTITPGATPSVASPTSYSGFQLDITASFSGTEVQSDSGLDNGGGVGVCLVNRNDLERGRFIAVTNSEIEIANFRGVTTNKTGTRKLVFLPESGTQYGATSRGSMMVEIDYDDTTYWGRYIHVSATNSGAIFLVPFNFNWDTGAFVLSDPDDLPYSPASATVSSSRLVAGVLVGSDAASNIVILYEETTAGDFRYIDVPIVR